ncbi:MAG: universal stress protein [Actinobacteria bacterium]|nr:universal stress protein [Actinomycetota bacterium]
MRLLVAVDAGAPGRDALELARVLCIATGSDALVVHVLFAGPLPMEFALLPEEEAAEATPLFEQARKALTGIEVETRAFGGGSPGAIITSLSEEEEEELDGIVLGSPHRHGPDRLLSGSVAISVLNGAKTDVFVAPPGYADESHDGLKAVAVGYLGTSESKVALRRALDLVDPAGRIELLTVAEPPLPLSFQGEDMTNPTDPEAVLAEGMKLVPEEVEVEPRRLDGPVAPELEKAGADGVDLLVLGSRGYGPVMRVLLGSVSGHVFRHPTCPLLVARRP